MQGDDAAMAVQLQQMPAMPRAAMAAVVLARLRSVPWSRVDCAWRDATVSVFAHNNIQVTRGWLNWDVRPSISFSQPKRHDNAKEISVVRKCPHCTCTCTSQPA